MSEINTYKQLDKNIIWLNRNMMIKAGTQLMKPQCYRACCVRRLQQKDHSIVI